MFQKIMKYLLPLVVLGLIAYAVYDSFFRPQMALAETPPPMFVSTEIVGEAEAAPSYAAANAKPDKDYKYWVADVIWERMVIIGGSGPFPSTDTLSQHVEDAAAGIWLEKEPTAEDYTNWAKPPAPGYECVLIQDKRLWHYEKKYKK